MKKRVGIITLNGYFNYGNRLQNFALQKSIEGLGFTVHTIVHYPGLASEVKRTILQRVRNVFTTSPMTLYRKVVRIVKDAIVTRRYAGRENRRTEAFMDFTSRYILETKQYLHDEHLDDLNADYDYFIAGSDQVWNPSYNRDSSFYFLTFADPNKRIAYAPSFGVSSLPELTEVKYSKWLSDFSYLSVRENEGAQLIKRLCGREAPVVLDPTMLLCSDQWHAIADQSSVKLQDKYILTYFIGELSKDYKTKIKCISQQLKIRIVNLGKAKYSDTYSTGPAEFLNYIRGCTLFLTDSFHGSVFSIIFEKPFQVFKRIDNLEMNSRIDTLLSMFKLQERQLPSIELDSLMELDYNHAREILRIEKGRAFAYLKMALGKSDTEEKDE